MGRRRMIPGPPPSPSVALQRCLDDFRELGYRLPDDVRVLEDIASEDHEDLIAVSLGAMFPAYLGAPVESRRPWSAVVEPVAVEVTLDAAGLVELAADITALAALVRFVEARFAD